MRVGPSARRRRLRSLAGPAAPAGRLPVVDRRPRATALAAGALAAGGGAVIGGPVAGLAMAVYGALAVLALLNRRGTRRADEATGRALDAVAVLAGDLRAGTAAAVALDAARPALAAYDVGPVARLAERVGAAWEVAESAGAPLADLFERLEADARGLERMRRSAAAESAGVTATALLLTALPVAGIGVGYAMGADPVRILLHTRVGAACAALALLLQLAGLVWSRRLARGIDDTAAWRPRRGPRGATEGRGAAASSRDQAGPSAVGALPARTRWMAAALLALAVAVLIGGWGGAAAAPVGAVVAERYLRRVEPARTRAERLRAESDLPFAADLLAAALRAGLPTPRAVAIVAGAVDGPVGRRLARVARSVSLGLTVEEAWRPMRDLVGGVRLSAVVVRSAESGSALAVALARLADDLRERRSASAETAARRAAVHIVLPLGLCFLPAFVFAGIVPVIVAVLGDVLRY